MKTSTKILLIAAIIFVPVVLMCMFIICMARKKKCSYPNCSEPFVDISEEMEDIFDE